MAEGGEGRYGRLLGADEYDQRLTRLHDRAREEAGGSPSPGELDRRVRALELDLDIDRRLGVDFPQSQRDELIRVRERVEEQRRQLTGRLQRREISTREFAEGLQATVDSLVADLSASLTPDEVKSFLGIPDSGAARLSFDPRRFRLRRGRR